VLLFTHHVTLLFVGVPGAARGLLPDDSNAYGVLVALVAGGAVFVVSAFAGRLRRNHRHSEHPNSEMVVRSAHVVRRSLTKGAAYAVFGPLPGFT